ncbi:hypothetical protein ABIA40_000860 [Bradyrhizobium sp. USDA 223]
MTKQSSGEISRENAKACLHLHTRCHRPRRRAIQYAETPVIETRGARRAGFLAFVGNDKCYLENAASPHTPSLRAQRLVRRSLWRRRKQSRIFPRRDSGLLRRKGSSQRREGECERYTLSCPGRSAASPRRCEASSGSTMRCRAGAHPSAIAALPRSRLCAATLARCSLSGTRESCIVALERARRRWRRRPFTRQFCRWTHLLQSGSMATSFQAIGQAGWRAQLIREPPAPLARNGRECFLLKVPRGAHRPRSREMR